MYLDPVKAVEAMKTGDLCTAFILDSTDFRARAKLSDLDCSLVSMDETHVDALIAACPYYRKTTYETVTDDGTEQEGLNMGALDFIKKPIINEVLRVRVNHILELSILRKRYRGKKI